MVLFFFSGKEKPFVDNRSGMDRRSHTLSPTTSTLLAPSPSPHLSICEKKAISAKGNNYQKTW